MSFTRILSGLAVILAVLLTACAGSGGGSEASGDAAAHGGDHASQEKIVPPVEGADEVTIRAVDIDYEPATLQLTAGQPVNLTVVNGGETMHDFTLEEADVHVNVEPGESKTTSITIAEPGTYRALCTVTGHADGGMTIEVVVT